MREAGVIGWISALLFGSAAALMGGESDILFSKGTTVTATALSGDSAWTSSPSGQSLFMIGESGGDSGHSVAIHHDAFPASSAGATDHRIGLNYRADLFEVGFLESRSTIDESQFGPYSQGYRQVVGYGLRLLDKQSLTFDVVPGVIGDFSADRPIEERLKVMGNFNQNLSWRVSDGFVVTQNFNTTVERTEEDDLSAVMNLDLETLFSDRLSFKLSYEVHYDDSIGDELEQRDARLSTSVGFRF